MTNKQKNKTSDLPSDFYWRFKSNIINYDDHNFMHNFSLCCNTYHDWESWSRWQNGIHSSEYNHALYWLWENDYICVLPIRTFDNVINEDSYNYDTKKYELTSEDYKWLIRLIKS